MNEYILDIDKRNSFIKNIQDMECRNRNDCKRLNKTMLEAVKYIEKSKKYIKYYSLNSVIFIQVNSIKEEFAQIKNLKKFTENMDKNKKIVFKNEDFYNFLIITFNKFDICIEVGSSKYLELNEKEITIDYTSFYRKGYYQFKDEYSIEVKTKKGYYYPLTLKDIEQSNFLFYIFFRKYFLVLAKENLLIKDLLKDYTNKKFWIDVPITFSLLRDAKNKKHLLEIKIKDKVPASLNKYPLYLSYTFLKSIKYLKDKEDIPKLIEFIKAMFSENYSKKYFYSSKEIDKIKEFFEIYFCFILKIDSYKTRRIIEDYINLCFLEKRKINLKIKSYKRIEKEHNELAMKNRLKNQKIEIRKNNPFLKLKLPDEFEIIKDAERLYQEGILNRNCVFSYLDYINLGKCMIYSTVYEEERHTIEIGIEDNKFILKQIRTYANSEANSKLVKEVKKILEKENQRLC